MVYLQNVKFVVVCIQLTQESKISVKAEEWWRGSLSSTAAATYSGKGGDSEVVGCKCNPGV
jgi:hypothetical protein